MVVYSGTVCKKGDCRTFFHTGRCPTQHSTCAYSHHNCLPKSEQTKGKGKGKGKKGKGKGKKGKGKGKKDGKGKGKWQYGKGKGKDTKGKGKGKGKDGKGKGKGKRSTSEPPTRGKSPAGNWNRPLCRNHKSGNCPKGETCDFWHPKGPCRTFARTGACPVMAKCPFSHGNTGGGYTMPAIAQPKPKPQPKAKQQTKSQADLDKQAQSAADKAKAMQRKASDAKKAAAAGYGMVMLHPDVLAQAAADNKPDIQNPKQNSGE